MKSNLFAIVILIVVASNFPAIAQQDVHQHEHDVSQLQIELNNGEKWQIDESLHTGMSLIKQEILSNLDDIHNDRFTEQQYADLAIELDKQLSYLFTNCKLPPQADAQLHILLARIMQGAEQIKHKDDKKQGAVLVIKALMDYPTYFNDPTWQSFQH